MIHVGQEPPWPGYSKHYGSWKALEPLWDETVRWEWVPPGIRNGVLVTYMADLLRDLYLPKLDESPFLAALLKPTHTVKVEEVPDQLPEHPA